MFPLQPEPVDVVRAGLKDGVISIAPNGAVELGSEGSLPNHSEMRPFIPPPLPAAAPPSAPSMLSSASLVTVTVVGSPNASDSASNTQGRGSVGSRGSESSLKVRRTLQSMFALLTRFAEEEQRHPIQSRNLQCKVKFVIADIFRSFSHTCAALSRTPATCTTRLPRPFLILFPRSA